MVFTELKKVIPTSFELRNHTIFKMILSVNIVTKTSLRLWICCSLLNCVIILIKRAYDPAH